MESWQEFMLESNRIEGENELNPDDEQAFRLACSRINSLDDILEIHKILGKHLERDWVGKWRTCNVVVGKSLPPHWYKVPVLMNIYGVKLKNFDSFEAHNQFELIHPFRDLNGRVGRLIWLSKAIKEGYNFEIPFLQAYYYQTLNRCRDNKLRT